jgi:hypothetical protein
MLDSRRGSGAKLILCSLALSALLVSSAGAQGNGSPAQPTNLLVTSVTATSAAFSWQSVPGAASYQVEVATDSKFHSVASSGSTSSTSIDVNGLAGGTTYLWHVRADNGKKESDWKEGASFATEPAEAVVQAPVAPGLVSPSNNAKDIPADVTLSWSSVEGADSYRIQISTDANFASTVTDEAGLTATSFGASGLSQGAKYHWRVSAANAGGTSPWSSKRALTVASSESGGSALSSPASVDPPSGLQVDNITSTSATLSWSGSSSAKFDVQLNPGSKSYSTNSSTLTITSLSPNTTYDWQVRSKSSNGKDTSDWVSGPSFTTLESPPPPPPKPPAPTGLSAAPTETGATLSWNGSAGATSYRVQVSTKANFPPGQTDQSVTTDTTLVIGGLSSQTTYFWRVSATNTAGTSGWSTSGFTTLGAQASQIPAVPTGLNATLTETGVTLSWNSSVGATSYRVEVSTKANFPPGQTDQDVTTADTSMAVGGLSSQTTYYWRVSATNAAGTSGWSTAGFTTLVTQPSQPPAAPTGLSATLTATGATLSWNRSTGAFSYRAEVSTKLNFPPGQTTSVTTSDTFLTVNGLTDGTTYYWQVGASNGTDSPSWSGVVSFTTTASGVTSVDPVDQTVPAGFRLSQNYPNPFNPSTTIEFSMPKSAHVRINIYNTLGDLVHTLVDENLSPGTHRRQWVASGLTSGVYFYRIQTNGYVETKRLVLLK